MPEGVVGITNEVLAERLEGVSHLISEKFTAFENTNNISHDTILVQVKKTNGTVIVNTARITNIEEWKNKIIGALIMTNLILLPVFFIIISNWFNGK